MSENLISENIIEENMFKKVNSSDYITHKKNITIAREYNKANTISTFNPIKKDGYTYNTNFKFIPTTGTADASNCLIYSNNFTLLYNYKNGVKYIKNTCT